ncbi:MAG TPA: hypothetical protein VFE24_15030 [Pirellulales bacterium]|jgi:hypothetical protein|nr:hypothetical protein [Pirellulales bacterium]
MSDWQDRPQVPPPSSQPIYPAEAGSGRENMQNNLSWLPPLGSPPARQASIGKLVDSGRKSGLASARGALIIAGLLLLVQGAIEYATTETQVEEALQKEVQKAGPGVQIDRAKYAEVKEQAIRVAHLFELGMVAVGIGFFVLAALVLKFPAGATIAGMVLYLGITAVLAFLNPMTLMGGWIWKIIILVSLTKGIQAGVALQRQERDDALAKAAPAPGV